MNKNLKTGLIVAACVLAFYFLFVKRRKKVKPSNDGSLPVASTKPILAGGGNPNAVNPLTGQPIQR